MKQRGRRLQSIRVQNIKLPFLCLSLWAQCMMQYKTIVLSETMVLFYTARDHESLKLCCNTSKKSFMLACVIHHFLYWLAFLWPYYHRIWVPYKYLCICSHSIHNSHNSLYMWGIRGKDEEWGLSREIKIIFRATIQMQPDVLCHSPSLQGLHAAK